MASDRFPQLIGEIDRFSTDRYLDSLDDEDSIDGVEDVAPDSNYDMDVTLANELDDSQVEIPVRIELDPDDTPPVPRALTLLIRPGAPPLSTNPRSYSLIENLCRVSLLTLTALGLILVATLVYVAINAAMQGAFAHPGTQAAIGYLLATLSFVFLLLTSTALVLLLVDVARNVNRMRQAASPDAASE